MDALRSSDRRRLALIGLSGAAVVIAILLHFGRSVGLTPARDRKRMPPLNLHLLSGGTWTLAEHRGQVIAINYWASWCGPCWAETPALIRLDRELGPQGLAIVGIAMDERDSDEVPRAVSQFLDRFHVPYAIGLNPPMSQMGYAMEGLPTTILVDREGRVARTYVGAIREAKFRADVESLLEESAQK